MNAKFNSGDIVYCNKIPNKTFIIEYFDLINLGYGNFEYHYGIVLLGDGATEYVVKEETLAYAPIIEPDKLDYVRFNLEDVPILRKIQLLGGFATLPFNVSNNVPRWHLRFCYNTKTNNSHSKLVHIFHE